MNALKLLQVFSLLILPLAAYAAAWRPWDSTGYRIVPEPEEQAYVATDPVQSAVDQAMEFIRDVSKDFTCDDIINFKSTLSEGVKELPEPCPHRDCKDAYMKGERVSKVYTINPDDQGEFDVYCDMDRDGGGWTVFQRRQDGSQDFNLGWNEYSSGFGDLNGEFWLGLEKIHRLTASASRTELRVDLKDFWHADAFAKFKDFAVGDSASKYKLSVSGFSGGNADDSLTLNHNGMKFSTKDQDNDQQFDEGLPSCNTMFTGGWWFWRCYNSNLNGMYNPPYGKDGMKGIHWLSWKPTVMKFSEMKLRRAPEIPSLSYLRD